MKILYEINYIVQVETLNRNVSTTKHYPITCLLEEMSAFNVLQEIEKKLGYTFGESYKILSFTEVLPPKKIYNYYCNLFVAKNGVPEDLRTFVSFSNETELTEDQLKEKAIDYLEGRDYELISINILP